MGRDRAAGGEVVDRYAPVGARERAGSNPVEPRRQMVGGLGPQRRGQGEEPGQDEARRASVCEERRANQRAKSTGLPRT